MTDDDKAGNDFVNNLRRTHLAKPEPIRFQPNAEPGNRRFSFAKLNQEHQQMATQSEEERARAIMAQNMTAAIERVEADWPFRLETIRLHAKTAKARYDALIREGFEPGQALHLCARPVEM